MRKFLTLIGGLIYRLLPLIVFGAIAVVFLIFAVIRLEWIELPSVLRDVLAAFFAALIGALPVVLFSWAERKVLGRVHNRIGPNESGPFGIIQAMADGIKMFTKEDVTPDGADRVMFNVAPILMGSAAFAVYGVLPFAHAMIGVDLSVALLYLLAMGSVTSVAVLMAGWSSNNKYALLGAFRSVSQLISYEIPLALALLTPIMLAGTMSTVGLVEAQEVPYFLPLLVSLFLFYVSSLAETSRAPFDILEADSEIVAGFFTEYSGMKFALFFLAEYAHMFAASMMTVILFFGGYRLPLLELIVNVNFGETFLAPFIIISKSLVVVFLFLWIRSTLPRIRLDQLLALNWKFLVPLSLVNVIVVAILAKLLEDSSLGLRTTVMLAANLLMLAGAGLALVAAGRRARERDETSLTAVTDAPQLTSIH